jgi:hypothetical protein
MVHDTPRRTRARQSAIRNANDEVKTYWIHGLELTVGQDTEPEATPKHVAGRRLRRETTYFQLPVTQHGEEMNVSDGDGDDGHFLLHSSEAGMTDVEENHQPKKKDSVGPPSMNSPVNYGQQLASAVVHFLPLTYNL